MSRAGIDPALLERLTEVFTNDVQIEDFLDICESAREGGRGYYQVTISFSNRVVDTIEGRFTRKPRRSDQGDAARWGR